MNSYEISPNEYVPEAPGSRQRTTTTSHGRCQETSTSWKYIMIKIKATIERAIYHFREAPAPAYQTTPSFISSSTRTILDPTRSVQQAAGHRQTRATKAGSEAESSVNMKRPPEATAPTTISMPAPSSTSSSDNKNTYKLVSSGQDKTFGEASSVNSEATWNANMYSKSS